jgi:hypothetical protein
MAQHAERFGIGLGRVHIAQHYIGVHLQMSTLIEEIISPSR